APPRTAKLVLSKPGKRLVVLILVLGFIGYAAIVAIDVAAVSTRTDAHNAVVRDYTALAAGASQFGGAVNACASDLHCVETEVAKLARAVETFAQDTAILGA